MTFGQDRQQSGSMAIDGTDQGTSQIMQPASMEAMTFGFPAVFITGTWQSPCQVAQVYGTREGRHEHPLEPQPSYRRSVTVGSRINGGAICSLQAPSPVSHHERRTGLADTHVSQALGVR